MKPIIKLISRFPLWKRGRFRTGLGGFSLLVPKNLPKAVAIKFRLFPYLLLLLIGLTRCATSHRERAIENESAEAAIMSGELEAQFTADYLSPDRLAVLEVRAQQKLLDFTDYLNIIADPAIDNTFRQQAEEQLTQLFIHPQTLVTWKEETLTLENCLNSIEQRSDNEQYIIQNIELIQPLRQNAARQDTARQESTRQYSGVLAFSQLSATEYQEATYQRKVEIWAKKVDKQFGSEQKQVWEIFLGTIE